MILDKMGPPTNHPKNAILSLAARSVLSKKDRDIMEEESKLLEKYYHDYYNAPMKGGSSRSRGSSTDTKGEGKHKKQTDTHLNSKIIEQNMLNRNSMDNIRKYNDSDTNNVRSSLPNINIKSLKESDSAKVLAHTSKPKEMTEEELGETLAKLEVKRKNITAMIYRLPIANRYMAVIQREKELYQELDQVNEAINQLSHNKVFVM